MRLQVLSPVVLGLLCLGAAPHPPRPLRLATTTSTADSGLLSALLPDFERACGCKVQVIAVGTGQALALGRSGDVDVLLVHAQEQEEAFVKDGFGVRRHHVMSNDFVVVGPPADPAGVRGAARVANALKAVATGGHAFASRGDKSGTHARELSLWKAAGVSPSPTSGWYLAVGQGMGETLTFANERQAYTLADRGTWLAMRDKVPALRLLFGGESMGPSPDPGLRNDYGVILVSPRRHPSVNAPVAERFVTWLLSPPTQERVGAFGRERHGQPLFLPAAGGNSTP
jgi:tungstate transport system substrate-binding protein